jgi:S-DNA-T family DNA segregation ATPase FtsK/SpoIIIE
LLKDERTHKIAGSIFLLFSILLFVAFTSYLFTWQDDQDKVFQLGKKLLWGTDVRVTNLLGTFGAFIAHFLFIRDLALPLI